MGRKVHPVGFRLGVIKDWQSRWYADRNYTELLHEDVAIRNMVAKRLSGASVSRVEIQRSANQIDVTLHTAKPGIVIGKGGQAVDQLRKDLEQTTAKKVKINIEEVKQPELDAFLIAESIAEQLSRRVSYRRALKQSIMRAIRAGAKGVRVRISGRLGGAEMARSVWEREGRVPLHTLRADIDYSQVHAHTTYGRIGVKVWVYRGDVIQHKGGDALLQMDRPEATAAPRIDRPDRPDRRDRATRRDGGPDAGVGAPARPAPGRYDRGGMRSDEVGGRARATGNPTPAPQRVASQTSADAPEGAGVQAQADNRDIAAQVEIAGTQTEGGTE